MSAPRNAGLIIGLSVAHLLATLGAMMLAFHGWSMVDPHAEPTSLSRAGEAIASVLAFPGAYLWRYLGGPANAPDFLAWVGMAANSLLWGAVLAWLIRIPARRRA